MNLTIETKNSYLPKKYAKTAKELNKDGNLFRLLIDLCIREKKPGEHSAFHFDVYFHLFIHSKILVSEVCQSIKKLIPL